MASSGAKGTEELYEEAYDPVENTLLPPALNVPSGKPHERKSWTPSNVWIWDAAPRRRGLNPLRNPRSLPGCHAGKPAPSCRRVDRKTRGSSTWSLPATSRTPSTPTS